MYDVIRHSTGSAALRSATVTLCPHAVVQSVFWGIVPSVMGLLKSWRYACYMQLYLKHLVMWPNQRSSLRFIRSIIFALTLSAAQILPLRCLSLRVTPRIDHKKHKRVERLRRGDIGTLFYKFESRFKIQNDLFIFFKTK